MFAAQLIPDSALEQSNLLLTTITYNLPQIVLFIADGTLEVVYKNYAAAMALEENHSFLQSFRRLIQPRTQGLTEGRVIEFAHHKRFYSVTAYPVFWKGVSSHAYLFNDMTAEKQPKQQEQTQAHQDPLTGLHNRLAGIMVLNKWLDRNSCFALCLANLDNIRYVNDVYGKQEGNRYILTATNQLLRFPANAVVTRTGGDEFMVLAPDFTQDGAETTMQGICQRMQETLQEKPYYSNMSYGIVAVDKDNTDTASTLLSLADERMCKAKILNKKRRMLTL